MSSFLQGLIIGFSIAAPVGPIGLLCLRRSLQDGRMAGFASGLGAATADALYGLVAGFGLVGLSQFLVGQQRWLQFGGAIFLVYLGVRIWRASSGTSPGAEATAPESAHRPNLGAAYFSTLLLTLTNPMTIVSFVGIFAGVGAGQTVAGAMTAGILVAGVFVGSASWWLLLSTAAGWLRGRLHRGALGSINRVAGGILALLGVWQLLQFAS